ncbi:MAG: hypothetical protein FWE45_04590 [Firmicutes bacterium]|nr:hypothetical protein [Bacillota bacterium]
MKGATRLIVLALMLVVTTIVLVACGSGNGNGLDSELRNRITQDYFYQLIKPIDDSVNINDLKIEREYGVFEEHIVVKFNSVISFPGGIVPIYIGGVTIDWAFANRIVVWRDGSVFTLVYAEENNLLSQPNLKAIASIDNTLLN